jgi:hypothetical protein
MLSAGSTRRSRERLAPLLSTERMTLSVRQGCHPPRHTTRPPRSTRSRPRLRIMSEGRRLAANRDATSPEPGPPPARLGLHEGHSGRTPGIILSGSDGTEPFGRRAGSFPLVPSRVLAGPVRDLAGFRDRLGGSPRPSRSCSARSTSAWQPLLLAQHGRATPRSSGAGRPRRSGSAGRASPR